MKDSSQSVVFGANYYPWGKMVITSGSPARETLRFTEMPYDSVTGLYFFGTRFYDPTIGRFVQMDTAPPTLSNPLTFNRYAYAGDNPMTYSDNTGRDYTTSCLRAYCNPIDPYGPLASVNWLPPWDWSTSQWASFGIFAGSAVGAVLSSYFGISEFALPFWGATAGSLLAMSEHGGQRPEETLAGAITGFASGWALGGGLFPAGAIEELSPESSFAVKAMFSVSSGLGSSAFSSLLTGDSSGFLSTLVIAGMSGDVLASALGGEGAVGAVAGAGIAIVIYLLYHSVSSTITQSAPASPIIYTRTQP